MRFLGGILRSETHDISVSVLFMRFFFEFFNLLPTRLKLVESFRSLYEILTNGLTQRFLERSKSICFRSLYEIPVYALLPIKVQDTVSVLFMRFEVI